MKTSLVYTLFGLAMLAFICLNNSAGRAASQNAGNTGAPGDETIGPNPRVCASCHAGANWNASVKITVKDDQDTIATYTPGETYRAFLEIITTDGSPNGYGFQMVSLIDSDTSDVNGWSNPASNVQIATTTVTGRSYAEHKGISSSNVFEVDWTAPALGSGDVTFYAGGNAVNIDGNTTGDKANITQFTLPEGQPSSVFDQLKLSDWKLFPNPATEFINVDIDALGQNNFSLMVYTPDGRLKLQQYLNVTAGKNISRLSLSSLDPGIYLCILTNENDSITRRFVKG